LFYMLLSQRPAGVSLFVPFGWVLNVMYYVYPKTQAMLHEESARKVDSAASSKEKLAPLEDTWVDTLVTPVHTDEMWLETANQVGFSLRPGAVVAECGCVLC
jgi:hypothetical protein